MGAFKEGMEVYEKVTGNKFLKPIAVVTLVLIGIAFIALVIIVIIKIESGEHVKTVIGEFNIPTDNVKTDSSRIQTKAVLEYKPTNQRTKPTVVTTRSKIGIIGNQTNMNSHVVNGDNSGINGNVTYNLEKQLTPFDKKRLLELIAERRRTFGHGKNCAAVNLVNDSNGSVAASQIRDFLRSQGFEVAPGGGMYWQNKDLKGIDVVMSLPDSCIHINIGIL